MASDHSIRRDPQWVTHDHASSTEFPASNRDAVQNPPIIEGAPQMPPSEPWRESQWRQAIEEIVGGITRLPHLRRHQHDVRDVVRLSAACRSYYQKVEDILDLMYKYLEIGHHHGDRDQHSSIPHRTMIIENLHRRENPLFLIIGRGEEYEFLRDSRMFRNSERHDASCFTNADMSFLQQFCDRNLPERLESALCVAVDCIKVDAGCRHTGAKPLAVRYVEDLSSEVLVQMLHFHYCRKSSLQARQGFRIEELEATVNNMLTVEDDLRAQNARLLDSLHRAEQQAETAENELQAETALRQQAEATVDNMLTVEDDLRAQNARLLDTLRRAEQQAEIAENELQAETTRRQQAEASRGRAVRAAEHRLRDEYARQHDEWFLDLRNYRTHRERYRPAFEHSVEAPGRASGNDRSWLDLRRETNELFTDLGIADNAQADLEADLSRVRRQRNHALRERDNLQGQLWHAQAHDNRQYHQPGRPYPR